MNEDRTSTMHAHGADRGGRLPRVVACVTALSMGMTLHSETAEARGLGWGGGIAIGAGALLLGAIMHGARRAHAAPHTRVVHEARPKHRETVRHEEVRVKTRHPREEENTASRRRDATPSAGPLDTPASPASPVATPRPIVPMARAPEPVAPTPPVAPATTPPVASAPATPPVTPAAPATPAPGVAPASGNVILTSTGGVAGADGPGAAGLH